jgi:beta-galactosidase
MRTFLIKSFSLISSTILIIGITSPTVQDGSTANCPTTQISTSTVEETGTQANLKRSQIYLNGIWQFLPAINNLSELPKQGWGEIWVPGDWQKETSNTVPGIIKKGSDLAWQNFNGKQLSKAWYQHSFDIPKTWQGRSILLDLRRVSTDAIIYVNGIQCGQINWPYGAVDITNVVKPGEPNQLNLLVMATADQAQTVVMNPNEILTQEANLDAKGLIGEVRLLSRPAGAYIHDVFVQTSTRNHQIKLDIEVIGIQQNDRAKITAELLNQQGKVEKVFTNFTILQANLKQIIQLNWKWRNPRLWDIEEPNLYTLRLKIQGKEIDDSYDQTFGFREFWIEGRKFYLNGKEIRWRPILHDESWVAGIPEVSERMISNYLWAGYNIAELWPWNHDERGKWHFRELFTEQADKSGFPIIAPALDIVRSGYVNHWNQKAGKQTWEPKMAQDLRRYRNHPSVLFWTTSANFFSHGDDQNPRRIGQKKVEGTVGKVGDERLAEVFPLAEDAVSTIKKYDQTRPVMVHHGASTGDIYATNSYLNLIPLQEREQWLSYWSKFGEMPYMVVEFGTPLHTTLMRGRNGFGKAIVTEPLMTEFSAIYLGKEAYKLETREYREQIRQRFKQEQTYQNWYGNHSLEFAPAFQNLLQLFVTNTWRSWRTAGITGGMIPWHSAQGWQVSKIGKEPIKLKTFESGHRGVYLQTIPKHFWNYLRTPEYNIQPAGTALLTNNRSMLAWIAGKSEEVTEKSHHFWAGETLQKQIVLINDSRQDQDFQYEWQVVINNQVVSTETKTGTIKPAQTLFFPMNVQLPTTLKQSKVKGEIQLKAVIGNQSLSDKFEFRVFKNCEMGRMPISQNCPHPIQVNKNKLAVFDPANQTTQMLKNLGYQVMPWDRMEATNLLIIGRQALSQKERLSPQIERFVRKGGNVLIFAQNPDWIQSLAMRISPHLSRRVFPIDQTHPVIKDLDSQDLRDWRGDSTLVAAYPDTMKGGQKLTDHGTPWYGWHWGNQGSVSSVPIEKPHLSSWRPILESEFDLAYTPLMELDYGKGRVILTTLDLEDNVPVDPVATQLSYQLIEYAATPSPIKKAEKVILIGDKNDAQKLDALGLIYQRSSTIEPNTDLLIIGSHLTVNEEQLKAYLQTGGQVFFLPRNSLVTILGVRAHQVANFGGSLSIPNWPAVAGLSASDLRSRSLYDAVLMQSGGEIAADGLLARVKIGNGIAIFSQIDPDILNADKNTYLRYTHWRYTRATTQILANLGATFHADRQIFAPASSTQLYHPDYRPDFDLGDDPYRYYRW